MGASLEGNRESGYYISGKNSELMGRIQRDGCPLCQFRESPCMGMNSMSCRGDMVTGVKDEELISVIQRAPCLGWMAPAEKNKLVARLGLVVNAKGNPDDLPPPPAPGPNFAFD